MKSFATIAKGYAGLNAGAWVADIPLPLFEGVRFKVRRLWNPDYAALQVKLSAEPSDLPEDDNARRIAETCMVETCLLGWDGVEEPFSVETAKALLTDAEFGPSFRNAVVWCCGQLVDQVKAAGETDEKN